MKTSSSTLTLPSLLAFVLLAACLGAVITILARGNLVKSQSSQHANRGLERVSALVRQTSTSSLKRRHPASG